MISLIFLPKLLRRKKPDIYKQLLDIGKDYPNNRKFCCSSSKEESDSSESEADTSSECSSSTE